MLKQRIFLAALAALFVILLISCNKVDNGKTSGKEGINPKTDIQATKEPEKDKSTTTKTNVVPETSTQISKEPEPKNNNISANGSAKNVDSTNEIKYKVVNANYTDNEVIIDYPQITNLSDSDKQKRINGILKSEALKVLDFYEDTKNLSLKINFKITWESKNLLSVQYSGCGFVEGASYPLGLLYTVNIDMSRGAKLALKDCICIDKSFVEKFRNYKVKDPGVNQASAGAFDYILRNYSVDDLLRYFIGADSSYENSAFTFSYFTKDAIGISIEVPHAIGDHTEIELKYQEIKGNINTECEIWKDFSNSVSSKK